MPNSDWYAELESLVKQHCSTVDWIASTTCGIWGGAILVKIWTKGHDYQDFAWSAWVENFAHRLDAAVMLAYPTFQTIVRTMIPPEGMSPEEMMALPPEKLINFVVEKPWIN